jgi:hypothetical protein
MEHLPVSVWNPIGNPVPVSGSVVVSSGAVNVSNFPSTQPVSGVVSVGNFPASQPVTGTVSVSNLSAVLPVNPTGINPAFGQSYSYSVLYSGTPIPNLLNVATYVGALSLSAGTYQVNLDINYAGPSNPVSGSFVVYATGSIPSMSANIFTGSGMEVTYTGSTSSSGICTFNGMNTTHNSATTPTLMTLSTSATLSLTSNFVVTGGALPIILVFIVNLTRIS